MTIHKLKAYIEKLKNVGRSSHNYSEPSEALTELFNINELAKKMQQDYQKDFFKNITKSFYQQQIGMGEPTLEAYELLYEKLIIKKNDLQKPVFGNGQVEQVPIHRGMVVLGHEF